MGVISKMSALIVAHEKGYKHVDYLGVWREYKAYEPYNHGEVSYTGLPQMILVDTNGKARWATEEEVIARMNDLEKKDDYSIHNKLVKDQEAEIMEAKEISIMKKLGYKNPYADEEKISCKNGECQGHCVIICYYYGFDYYYPHITDE